MPVTKLHPHRGGATFKSLFSVVGLVIAQADLAGPPWESERETVQWGFSTPQPLAQ